MRISSKQRTFGGSRLLLAGLLALGCGQILDISDAKPRPTPPSGQGGQAGQLSEAGSANVPATGGAVAGMGEAGQSGGAGEAGASGGESLGGAGDTSGQAGTATGGNAGGGEIAGGGGTAGAPPKACVLAEQRCDPDSAKTPQVCNAFGQWLRNPAEGNGLDCQIGCDPGSGKCVECLGSETTCNDNYVKTCASGAWTQAPLPCAEFCKRGACVTDSSCASPKLVCGSDSCCLSLAVDGGTFARDGDATHMATITSFTMDKYEVTVGRLVAYYNWLYSSQGAAPAVGAGKSSHIPEDTGWSASYPLPATSQDMQAMLSCANVDPSAEPTPTFLNPDQALPANCLDFYTAYAFCIWDGGRLPTEAEWNYAAAGGSQERYYPWSDPPSDTSIDATRAVYAGSQDQIEEVGSAPAGNGRFGQADLEGNVGEWTLDYSAAYPASCVDCLQTTVSAVRVTRGGGYFTGAHGLKVALRGNTDPASPASTLGFRCVHDL